MQEKPKKIKRWNGEKSLPETGFLRLPHVLAVYPVSRSTWWSMVKAGLAPKPVKLSRRCAAWRVEDIRTMIEGR